MTYSLPVPPITRGSDAVPQAPDPEEKCGARLEDKRDRTRGPVCPCSPAIGSPSSPRIFFISRMAANGFFAAGHQTRIFFVLVLGVVAGIPWHGHPRPPYIDIREIILKKRRSPSGRQRHRIQCCSKVTSPTSPNIAAIGQRRVSVCSMMFFTIASSAPALSVMTRWTLSK